MVVDESVVMLHCMLVVVARCGWVSSLINSPGQMRVLTVVTVEVAVVSIHTFGVICDGKLKL